MKENSNINPYKVPEGYFDEMQNKILAKTKKDGFGLPDEYFDKLQEDVISSTTPLSAVKGKRILWTSIAAASVILLVATLGLFWKTQSTGTNTTQLISIQDGDTDVYLGELSDDLNIDQLAELLEIEDIDKLTFEDDIEFDDIKYLEDIDVEDLQDLF